MSALNKIKKIKKLKKIRIHHEGTSTLSVCGLIFLAINGLAFWISLSLLNTPWLGVGILLVTAVIYGIMINFFRCPIRYYNGETEGVVVAPADGKIVVLEEVEDHEYFHDTRKMVSIFMSLTNVHANWFPVDGVVKKVEHHNGNFHAAYLPKASLENERSTIIIDTEKYGEILVRQVAGAMARRIVTYARKDEECYIDEHIGFIKFGSRVDLLLPLDAEITVSMNQATTGNGTMIAKLHPIASEEQA